MDDEHVLNLAYLKCHSLFGGVTDEAFELVKPHLRIEHFPAGATIIDEGQVNDRIYFIYRGLVEVTKTPSAISPELSAGAGLAANERHIAVMHEGDTFGEMELIDVQPCAATVRALEDTSTLTLSNRDLYQISKVDMKTYALLVMNLAREISRRLRVTDDLIAQTEVLQSSSDRRMQESGDLDQR